MAVHIESIRLLFDHAYWATGILLERASHLQPEEWTAAAAQGERGLRDGLVHCLDVERSWRLRLIDDSLDEWRRELAPADYPAVADLATAWESDQAEMRAWLATIDDAAMELDVDLGPRNTFPLGTFLLHVVLHTAQERGEVALLLTRLGLSPGNLDYLDYMDWQGRPA